MGQYGFARWLLLSVVVVVCRRRLLSSVTLPEGGRAGRQARGRSGVGYCTAGQYGYLPLGQHLVHKYMDLKNVTGCITKLRLYVFSSSMLSS